MRLREQSPQLVSLGASSPPSYSLRCLPWATHRPGGPAGRSPPPGTQAPSQQSPAGRLLCYLLRPSPEQVPALPHLGHSVPHRGLSLPIS